MAKSKFNAPQPKRQFSEGQKSKGILDDYATRGDVATKEGTIEHTPTLAKHIVNKEYVDAKEVESFPTTLTAGSVVFSDGTNLTQDNFNLFWDDAINQLEPNLIKITSDGTQAAPALKFNDTNTGFFKSGDSIRLSLNNSTKMTIDSTGVGIGTATPQGKLDVFANDGVYFSRDADPTGQHLKITADSGGNYIRGVGDKHLYIRNTDNDKLLIFGAGGENNHMTIDSTGDVGIGTTAPTITATKGLHITGSASELHLTNSGSGTTANDGFIIQQWSDNNTYIYNREAASMYLGVNNSTDMTILNGGNVGIGTATPAAKLQVAGAIQSATKSISSDTDALDVTGVNTVFVTTSGGSVTIGGLANGLVGQTIHIVKITSLNNLVIENNEATGTQKILTADAGDITLGTYGGVTMVYSGSFWYVVSQ